MHTAIFAKRRILIFGLLLILACSMFTVLMAVSRLTAFTPDILNGHYILTTFTPDVSNGHYIQNGHI